MYYLVCCVLFCTVPYRTALVRVQVPYYTGRREYTTENVASLVAISFFYIKSTQLLQLLPTFGQIRR
jgi:hypothetical protein